MAQSSPIFVARAAAEVLDACLHIHEDNVVLLQLQKLQKLRHNDVERAGAALIGVLNLAGGKQIDVVLDGDIRSGNVVDGHGAGKEWRYVHGAIGGEHHDSLFAADIVRQVPGQLQAQLLMQAAVLLPLPPLPQIIVFILGSSLVRTIPVICELTITKGSHARKPPGGL